MAIDITVLIWESRYNTVATADKGRVPVSVEENGADSSSLVGSAHAGGWILRQAKSFSGVAPI